jgi:CheY-like chemotaxis protein
MKRIALVVDDSMLIRHTVCRYFEDRGFAVESATNGLEALQMLESIRPDIILTDIDMPKLDGHQLIEALKSNPRTSDIPVVVLAGRQSATSHLETRADQVIFKDIDIESQLQQVLRKMSD